MHRLLACLLCSAFVACGPKHTPRERYVQAINQRVDGDAHGHADALIALAHEQPDSRAGRRARATLQSGSAMTTVAVVGILAAIAIPNFLKFQARAKQSEAKSTLKLLFTAQKTFFAEHGHYCKGFTECGVEIEPTARYVYFLGPRMVSGGGGSDDAEALFDRSGELWEDLHLRPEVKKNSFLIVAVGNVDGDAALDVWTIDQDNNLENRLNDLN